MKNSIAACAPGKLILSGEHSVVYGAPALAVAINKFAKTSIVLKPRHKSIIFDFSALHYKAIVTRQKLATLKTAITNKYAEFLQNKRKITNVLANETELLLFAFIYLIDNLDIYLDSGITINVDSAIPIGCGMGSSAATIISMLKAVAGLFELNLAQETLVKFGRDIENMQHGYSSGLDVLLAVYGGCIRFEKRQMIAREIKFKPPVFIVNTGRPLTTTGECVTDVAPVFAVNKQLVADFARVTNAIDRALQVDDILGVLEGVKNNHQLLVHIGVVPEKVQKFVAEIEKLGGAAKVCGAGATKGQSAGIVLVIADDNIASLVEAYGYTMFSMEGNINGAQII